MTTKEKADEIFEFYYGVIPYSHTNKQRAEVAVKCSLKLVNEMLVVYQKDFYSMKFWNEVESIIRNKLK